MTNIPIDVSFDQLISVIASSGMSGNFIRAIMKEVDSPTLDMYVLSLAAESMASNSRPSDEMRREIDARIMEIVDNAIKRGFDNPRFTRHTEA